MKNVTASFEGIDLESFLLEKMSLYNKESIDANLEEILRDALFTVRGQLGVNVAFVSEFSGGRRVIQAVDSSDDQPMISVGDSDPLEESYCQHVVDGRFPNLINDAMSFSPARILPVTAILPVRAHASVPISFSDGATYGTFCCFSTEMGKEFSGQDLMMMNVFSEFAGRQIERARNQHRKSLELADIIRSIIDNGKMHPVFQPICHLRENRIIGYESLTRFDVEHYRPPDLWFSAAEAVGLQAELEILAIKVALTHIDQIPEGCYLAVNVSPATVSDPSFVDSLSHYSLDRVVLEVTEHASVMDYALFNEQLHQLRGLGVRLA